MPTITHYIKQSAVFDPDALSVMGAAYESALKSFPTPAPISVREVMASRIISGARDGERDPERLFRIAVAGLRVEVP